MCHHSECNVVGKDQLDSSYSWHLDSQLYQQSDHDKHTLMDESDKK